MRESGEPTGLERDSGAGWNRRPSRDLRIDHVLIAASDLDVDARRIEHRYGLLAIEGGRHPGWGTANRIVPLGDAYLELVAVVDQDAAASSVFGRWAARYTEELGRPYGWAVRTDQLDGVAKRLGLIAVAGERRTRSGDVLRWRTVGLREAAAEPALPFFIEWELPAVLLPGRRSVDHPAKPRGISKVIVGGDMERVAAWLGDDSLPVVVRPGASGFIAVVVACASGEITVAADPPSV